MAVDLATIVKQLEDSGIVAPETLRDFVPPKANPKNPDELVQALVQSKNLTPFQAQQVKLGKAKALVLGSYTILEKIGAGGMGQVFKAQHRKMKRLVAIKLLPPAMVKDAAAIKRFQREVEAAARLSHPNIVQAYDADEAHGVHYLVMEYVEGTDLSGLLKQRGPLPVAEACDYIRQAAVGLAFAHADGVVHRDIKPANLLVDKKGVVKILDMGLARIDEIGGAADNQLTNTGQVMGTVDYMAPEQAADTRHADAKSDVYSLGCSLYRLLTGVNLFESDTVVKKILAHMNQPIPSIKDRRPDVPDAIEALYQRMVAKRQADRPAMAEVVAAIDAWNGTNPTTGSGPGSGSELTSDFLNQMSGVSIGSASGQPLGVMSDDGMTTAMGNQRLRSIMPEATMTHMGAEADTDPKSQVSLTRTRRGKLEVKAAGQPPPGKNPKVLIGAGAAGFLLVLLGVIVIIRNDKGEEVARMNVPEKGTVEIKSDDLPAAALVTNRPTEPPAVQPATAPLATKAPVVAIGPAAIASASTDFALKFDGDGVVEIPDLMFDLAASYTMEAFVLRPAKADKADGRLFDVFNESTMTFTKAGRWRWVFRTQGGGGTSEETSISNAPSRQQRTHLACVRDGQTHRLYLGGKLFQATEAPNPQNDRRRFLIGEKFRGIVNEVRVSKVARYKADFTPPSARFTPDADTLGLYHFDEGTGKVLKDSSGNHHDGKITGAQWVKIDGSEIVSVQPSAGSLEAQKPAVVYLDDLPEIQWHGKEALGKHGLDVIGRPFEWHNVQPEHALMTAPESEGTAVVVYDLGGKYDTFAATVLASHDKAGAFAPLTFRVFGDDRELWKSAPWQRLVPKCRSPFRSPACGSCDWSSSAQAATNLLVPSGSTRG